MLSRRRFLQKTAAASLLSVVPGIMRGEPPPAPPARKLNVLFLMVDDMRPELNCYGVPEIKSPNIDRLAARGMKFDRAYCQFPVCSPSRSSMITGLRPETLGIFTNEKDDIFRLKRPDVVTLPQLFRQNGYDTASFGKVIHNGINAAGKLAVSQDPPSWDVCQEEGFNEAGIPGGEKVDYTGKFTDPKQRDWCWWQSAPELDRHPDIWVASQVIEQLKAPRHKPFFIAGGFHKPHDPYVAPSRCYDLYPPETVQLPVIPADRTPDAPHATSKSDLFSHFNDEDKRALKRAYHACISFTDAQLGRVLDAVDQLKLWDNTVVVLLIDHGYHLWEHDWWGKATTFDFSARVPCIVWAPGQPGMGTSTQGIVESLDMYPTICELCGLTPPPVVEGKSFVPLLKDPSGPGKGFAYTITRGLPSKQTGITLMDGRSVRTDRWRYTEWTDGHVALYDHSQDPGEYYNVAAHPENRAVCAHLKDLLHQINSHPA